MTKSTSVPLHPDQGSVLIRTPGIKPKAPGLIAMAQPTPSPSLICSSRGFLRSELFHATLVPAFSSHLPSKTSFTTLARSDRSACFADHCLSFPALDTFLACVSQLPLQAEPTLLPTRRPYRSRRFCLPHFRSTFHKVLRVFCLRSSWRSVSS